MFVIRASAGYLAKNPSFDNKWTWTRDLQKATVFPNGNALVALLWSAGDQNSGKFMGGWEFVEVTQDCVYVPAYVDRTIKLTGVVKT